MQRWTLEDHINDFVKKKLEALGLKNGRDFGVESAMNDYLKDALKGAAKTKNKTNFGKPDFNITLYKTPVLIENKLGLKNLVAKIKSKDREIIKFDDKSIKDYAVNGALHYARSVIASKKYHDAIAIGIAGNDLNSVKISVYYVYDASEFTIKLMPQNSLDFLQNKASFESFLEQASLSEREKHELLNSSNEYLKEQAQSLNKLMNDLNITVAQRVLYVSGMLLAMQDIIKDDCELYGLIPDDLGESNEKRDAIKVVDQIKDYLEHKKVPDSKLKLMLASFSEISKDPDRDAPQENHKNVSKYLKFKSSITKQIFTFIHENIFKKIDAFKYIDVMGELYTEFLKYALGDGKELGIVLTPHYVTKMMASLLDIDMNSRVMDLATGSAGFLITAMQIMIEDAQNKYQKGTKAARDKIASIKRDQLLGVELNAELYTLAATNMILRQDGSSKIQKANTFTTPEELYADFKADRILLNPPFTHEENGMPFIEFGLDHMQKGGLGAIIIQDSAGSGKAVNTNKKILKKHTLKASIKMPTDLFQPVAGVQTSIYIFEAHRPHDFDVPVKFIDFRNDGFKRTKRGLLEIDDPITRYEEIIKIYKAGLKARISPKLWGDLREIYTEDLISDSGADWNFDTHKIIDTKPKLEDFKKTVGDYLAWEVSQILKGSSPPK